MTRAELLTQCTNLWAEAQSESSGDALNRLCILDNLAFLLSKNNISIEELSIQQKDWDDIEKMLNLNVISQLWNEFKNDAITQKHSEEFLIDMFSTHLQTNKYFTLLDSLKKEECWNTTFNQSGDNIQMTARSVINQVFENSTNICNYLHQIL